MNLKTTVGLLLAIGISATPAQADAYGFDVFNVKNYGAVGDGVTNDWQAITDAIIAAGTNGGGTVYFPRGIYKVTQTVSVNLSDSAPTYNTSGIVLEGVGSASKIWASFAGGPVLQVGGTCGSGNPDAWIRVSGVKIRNLSVDRAPVGDSTSVGIDLHCTGDTLLEQVQVWNSYDGIRVGVVGGTDAVHWNWLTKIINCRLIAGGSLSSLNPAVYKIAGFANANIAVYSAADVALINNYLAPNHTGILLTNDSNGVTIDKQLILAEGADYGILSDGSGFARLVTNTIIEGAKHQQLYLANGWGFTLSNSHLGAGTDVSRGVLIESTVTDVTIANNYIGGQCYEGVLSYGSQVSIVSNRISSNNYSCFSGNTCAGCVSTTPSVSILSPAANVNVRGNQIGSGGDCSSISLGNGGANLIVKDNNISSSSTPAGCSNIFQGTLTNSVVADNK